MSKQAEIFEAFEENVLNIREWIHDSENNIDSLFKSLR